MVCASAWLRLAAIVFPRRVVSISRWGGCIVGLFGLARALPPAGEARVGSALGHTVSLDFTTGGQLAQYR